MGTKRIVITGGPGSGKTSIIRHLEAQGHNCMHEISRAVIQEAQKQGIEQLFLTDPLLFSKLLLEGRLKQFKEGLLVSSDHLFYDRGMPDVTAYMDYVTSHYPVQFEEICQNHRYDAVFVLPPWESIYVQDNERYETFEQATSLYKYLKKGYEKYDYTCIEVPVGPIAHRTEFILEKTERLF